MPPALGGPRPLWAIVMAAGASRRFGDEKLTQQWRGGALVEHAVDAALDAGVRDVVVAVRPGSATAALVATLPVRTAPVPPNAPFSASLGAALGAIPPDSAVLLLLGDMPRVDGALIRRLIECWRADPSTEAVATRHGATLAPPCLFSAALRPALLQLQGDVGPRALLGVLSDGLRVIESSADTLYDVDTPADLAALSQSPTADASPS